MCRKMWGLIADGAQTSYGTTSNGSIFILTSQNEEMQKKIAALWKESEALMGS